MFTLRKFCGSIIFFSSLLGHPALRAQPVKVVMEDAADPWSKKDGTGYANEIVRASLNAVHAEVEYSVQPYFRCKANVIKGLVAACLSMSFSEEFKDTVVFSDLPLFECSSDFYKLKSSAVKARTMNDIPVDSLVGVVAGYEYPPAVNDLKKRGIGFIQYPSENSLIKNLLAGRVNYILINHNEHKPLASIIKHHDPKNKIVAAFNAGTLESYIGFSKKNENGEWLKKKFDEGYQIISKNGTLDKINKKWIREIE